MNISTIWLCATIALALAGPLHAQQQDVYDPSEPNVSNPPDSVDRTGILPADMDCGTELFNNGPMITSSGDGPGGSDVSLVQNSSLGMTTIGAAANLSTGGDPYFRIADDFTLSEDTVLRCLVIYAYQTSSETTSTLTSANIRLWDGIPDEVGSSLVFGDTTTDRMLDTGWTGIYRFAEDNIDNTQRPLMWLLVDLGDTMLGAGTYWIDWQATGSIASGPWAPPISIIGESSTGNARQLASGGWQDYVDGGLNTPQGIPFLVFGGEDGPQLDTPPLPVPGPGPFALVLLALITLSVASWRLRCSL